MVVNGITESDIRTTENSSVLSEMIHWLLYSVALSLLYFALTLLVWWVTNHPVTWAELLKSGGLVTYASTLSSKTAGEYIKSGSRITPLTSFCVFGLICILASSAGVYGLLLSLGTAAPQPPSSAPFVAPERLVEFSWSIAIVAIVYGFCFTLNGKIRARQS
jgi:hypothetical protein